MSPLILWFLIKPPARSNKERSAFPNLPAAADAHAAADGEQADENDEDNDSRVAATALRCGVRGRLTVVVAGAAHIVLDVQN